MKRLLSAVCVAVCAIAAAVAMPAQMTPVTATQLRMSGALIPAGTVSFALVNNIGQPQATVTSDGQLNSPDPFMATVTNGAIAAGFTVPDQCLTVSVNAASTPLFYKVQIQRTGSSVSTFTVILPPGLICGSTSFALDHPGSTSVPVAAAPTALPVAGTYTGSINVALATATSAGVLHYTTDGSTPTSASPTYGSAIPVSANTTIKVIACATGYACSPVSTLPYMIGLPVAAAPTATPAAGAYSATVNVVLATATTGGVVHCTTDGVTTPTSVSPTCSTAIPVSASETIKAITIATGYANSPVSTFVFTISSSASLYPQTQPISNVTLGENGAMNGFLPGCPSPTHCSVVFRDITSDPVDAVADAAFHGYSNYNTAHIGPNFDSTGASQPWYWVDSSVETLNYLPVTSQTVPTENDDTAVPIKSDMVQEGNGNPNVPWTGDGRDRHLVVGDRATAHADGTYQWQTKTDGTGDVYSNTGWNLLLPYEEQSTGGYTSEDGAGLEPAFMGVTYEDLAAGEIKHMLRGTVPHTSAGGYANGDTYGLYRSPASHAAPSGGGAYVAYMGEVLRLKAATVLPSACGPQGTVIFNALKKHGWAIADNGMFGLLQGTFDTRINQSDVSCISALAGSDFEVIDLPGTVLTAGELNPETLSAGATAAYDQTGKNKANSSDGQQATCAADATCGLGTLIANSPVAPTITSFTSSASTVALGSCVTLSFAGTNAVKTFVNNTYGVIDGNSGTLSACPTQSTSYTAKVRGLKGYAYSSPVAVTVTGPTVATPTSTPAPGSFTSATTVTLADATSASAIYYTTDGSSPSAGSTPYSAPFLLSTPTTVRAIAIKFGMINSLVLTAVYNVNIPGATPPIVGTANSGAFADGATQTTSAYTFTSGTTTILFATFTNTATLPTLTCGSTAATLITSAVSTASPVYTVAAYKISGLGAGSKTCSATYASSAYGTLAFAEYAGTSGVDAFASNNTGTYPLISCGSLTTTGTNRVGIVSGTNLYSAQSASSGYASLYSLSAATGATISLPTAATTAMTLNTNNDPSSGGAACVSLALKP